MKRAIFRDHGMISEELAFRRGLTYSWSGLLGLKTVGDVPCLFFGDKSYFLKTSGVDFRNCAKQRKPMSGNNHCIREEDFRSFKSGHEHGFTVLFNEWHVPICYFANSIIGNMQEAEDITEDCFIILWQRRNDFTSPLSCKSFLYTSVRNACISIIRHRQVIMSGKKELQYLHVNNITLLDQVIASELAGQIQDAIESLPLECRKIFHLLFREGKSNPEVAKTLNLSVKTVKAQRQRGLSLLRKRILPLFFIVIPIFFFIFFQRFRTF